jgi:hypothetical protein
MRLISNIIYITLLITGHIHAKQISQMTTKELVSMSEHNIKNYCKSYANDDLEHEKMMWKVFCTKNASNKMKVLLISNVNQLSKKDVTILSQFPFIIFENTSIDEKFATNLATFKGQGILFSRLSSIDVETVKAIVQFKGKSLIFTALKELNPMIAKELAKFQGAELDLAGLETLNVETARELQHFQGSALQFGGLKSISPEVKNLFKDVKFYTSGI